MDTRDRYSSMPVVTQASPAHSDPSVSTIRPAAEWVPALAEAVGAKPPRRLPRWLIRLVAGEATVVMMTEVRGASNAKAKRELGWELRYPSWRQGFREGLG